MTDRVELLRRAKRPARRAGSQRSAGRGAGWDPRTVSDGRLRARAQSASCAKELPRDDLALHLGSALVDARGTHLAVEVLERVAGFERAGAVHLDGDVDRALRGLG